MTNTVSPQPQYSPFDNARPRTAPQHIVAPINGYAPVALTDRPMAAQGYGAQTPTAPKIDQGKYWVGSVLTATVAALAGVIGIVVVRGILHIDLTNTMIGG